MFQRLHQNPHVARGLVGGPGVPKSCTRTPTLVLVFSLLPRWGGVGVVFQKVVPESPLCISGGVPKRGGVPKVVPGSPLCILLTSFAI